MNCGGKSSRWKPWRRPKRKSHMQPGRGGARTPAKRINSSVFCFKKYIMKTKKGSRKSDSASLVPKKDVPTPLTDDLREEFLQFLDFHSAQRLSKNLRKMLLEFLSN